MARGEGEGFRFFSESDAKKSIEIAEAEQDLCTILTDLDQWILSPSRVMVIYKLKEFSAAISQYRKLIPEDYFHRLRLIIKRIIEALETNDVNVKRANWLMVMSWNAANPRFILHVPELKRIVFGR